MTSTAAGMAGTRDPSALGGLLAGVGFFGGVAAAKATEKSPYPRPGCEPEEVQRYFTESATSARLSAAGLAISTAALGIFTASVAALARRSPRGSRALQAAAILGGGFAIATQAASAAGTVALTRKDNDPDTVRRLREMSFLLGGPAHGVGLGVLSGVLGVAGLTTGALPRSVSATALVSAPMGILGPLTLLKKQTMVILPVGHALSLVISGIAGILMATRSRKPR